jgi:16S rRNA processing protein RimM
MERTAGSTSSTDSGGRAPTDGASRVSVGRIVGAHGLRGELRVRVEGGDTANLMGIATLWLAQDEGTSSAVAHTIERVREGRSGECRMALAGITDRNAAEALRGATLWVRAEDLPPLEPGEYYAYELVGCRVEDTTGKAIGLVARIWETGAQDLLVIAAPEGGEHLVPAAEPILQEVDLSARRLVIDPPPGLLDAPSAKSR